MDSAFGAVGGESERVTQASDANLALFRYLGDNCSPPCVLKS